MWNAHIFHCEGKEYWLTSSFLVWPFEASFTSPTLESLCFTVTRTLKPMANTRHLLCSGFNAHPLSGQQVIQHTQSDTFPHLVFNVETTRPTCWEGLQMGFCQGWKQICFNNVESFRAETGSSGLLPKYIWIILNAQWIHTQCSCLRKDSSQMRTGPHPFTCFFSFCPNW